MALAIDPEAVKPSSVNLVPTRWPRALMLKTPEFARIFPFAIIADF